MSGAAKVGVILGGVGICRGDPCGADDADGDV